METKNTDNPDHRSREMRGGRFDNTRDVKTPRPQSPPVFQNSHTVKLWYTRLLWTSTANLPAASAAHAISGNSGTHMIEGLPFLSFSQGLPSKAVTVPSPGKVRRDDKGGELETGHS